MSYISKSTRDYADRYNLSFKNGQKELTTALKPSKKRGSPSGGDGFTIRSHGALLITKIHTFHASTSFLSVSPSHIVPAPPFVQSALDRALPKFLIGRKVGPRQDVWGYDNISSPRLSTLFECAQADFGCAECAGSLNPIRTNLRDKIP